MAAKTQTTAPARRTRKTTAPAPFKPEVLDQTTAVKDQTVRVQRDGAEDLIAKLGSWSATQIRVTDLNGKKRVFTPSTVVVFTMPQDATATVNATPATPAPAAKTTKTTPAAPVAAPKGPRTVKGEITDPTNGGTTAPREHLRPVANAACKNWAAAQGHTFSPSGHVRKHSIDAFLEAFPKVGVSKDAKLVMHEGWDK